MIKRKFMGVLAVTGAILVSVTLSGCGEDTRYVDQERENIKLGQECFEAGGSWNHNAWDGYNCEFIQEGTKD